MQAVAALPATATMPVDWTSGKAREDCPTCTAIHIIATAQRYKPKCSSGGLLLGPDTEPLAVQPAACTNPAPAITPVLSASPPSPGVFGHTSQSVGSAVQAVQGRLTPHTQSTPNAVRAVQGSFPPHTSAPLGCIAPAALTRSASLARREGLVKLNADGSEEIVPPELVAAELHNRQPRTSASGAPVGLRRANSLGDRRSSRGFDVNPLAALQVAMAVSDNGSSSRLPVLISAPTSPRTRTSPTNVDSPQLKAGVATNTRGYSRSVSLPSHFNSVPVFGKPSLPHDLPTIPDESIPEPAPVPAPVPPVLPPPLPAATEHEHLPSAVHTVPGGKKFRPRLSTPNAALPIPEDLPSHPSAPITSDAATTTTSTPTKPADSAGWPQQPGLPQQQGAATPSKSSAMLLRSASLASAMQPRGSGSLALGGSSAVDWVSGERPKGPPLMQRCTTMAVGAAAAAAAAAVGATAGPGFVPEGLVVFTEKGEEAGIIPKEVVSQELHNRQPKGTHHAAAEASLATAAAALAAAAAGTAPVVSSPAASGSGTAPGTTKVLSRFKSRRADTIYELLQQ